MIMQFPRKPAESNSFKINLQVFHPHAHGGATDCASTMNGESDDDMLSEGL
jgi:hypothetical protein